MQKLVLILETDLRTLEVVRWLSDSVRSLPSKCAALPWVKAVQAVFRLAKPIAITVVALDILLMVAAWLTPGPQHFKLDPAGPSSNVSMAYERCCTRSVNLYQGE